MAKSKRGYLEPKVGDPDMIRQHHNGMFVNPPTYMELGGFSSASKFGEMPSDMKLEKGGPKAKQGKPI